MSNHLIYSNPLFDDSGLRDSCIDYGYDDDDDVRHTPIEMGLGSQITTSSGSMSEYSDYGSPMHNVCGSILQRCVSKFGSLKEKVRKLHRSAKKKIKKKVCDWFPKLSARTKGLIVLALFVLGYISVSVGVAGLALSFI